MDPNYQAHDIQSYTHLSDHKMTTPPTKYFSTVSGSKTLVQLKFTLQSIGSTTATRICCGSLQPMVQGTEAGCELVAYTDCGFKFWINRFTEFRRIYAPIIDLAILHFTGLRGFPRPFVESGSLQCYQGYLAIQLSDLYRTVRSLAMQG